MTHFGKQPLVDTQGTAPLELLLWRTYFFLNMLVLEKKDHTGICLVQWSSLYHRLWLFEFVFYWISIENLFQHWWAFEHLSISTDASAALKSYESGCVLTFYHMIHESVCCRSRGRTTQRAADGDRGAALADCVGPQSWIRVSGCLLKRVLLDLELSTLCLYPVLTAETSILTPAQRMS